MMKRTLKCALAVALGLVVSGCTEAELAAALAGLTTGVYIVDDDDDGHCDNWYDFHDPGCW